MQTKTYRRIADHPMRAWHPSGQFRKGYTFTGFQSAIPGEGIVENNPPTAWIMHRADSVEEVA